MLIDYKNLSQDALQNLAKEYVCSQISETDANLDVEQWTLDVLNAIENGDLVIEYSELNESVYLKSPSEVALVGES